MKTLSIIIPVYNEAKTVDILLNRVFLAKLPHWKKSVIVIDDGSTDGTNEVLQKWNNTCTILLQGKNKGKGAALREGFKHAQGDIILIQDADLEYHPDDYKILLAPFDNTSVHIVYGSRFLGSHLSTMYIYAMGNKFVTWVTNILFNTNITDMETGYKAFRKDVLASLHLRANRFDFEPEFTAQVLKAGYQIYEVPISYFGRKFTEGKKLTWRDGIIALITLLRERMTG